MDSGLLSLLMIARHHGIAVDEAQLRHEFGQKLFVTETILLAAKRLGMTANVKDIELDVMAAHFCDLIKLGRVSSPLVPTPTNWPYIFEMFVSSLYLLRWNDFVLDVVAELESRLKIEILPETVAERRAGRV